MRSKATTSVLTPVLKPVLRPVGDPNIVSSGDVAPSNALSLGADNLLYLGAPSPYTNVLTLGA